MSHVLATILVTLALPAIALAVILFNERKQKHSHEELPDPIGERGAPPEFQVSKSLRTTSDSMLDEPGYREKAG